uniref:Uncharacterized protein n=1 Tax=viral metagenome TaxID=1070528 RepID=A0A6M3LGA5_9ZZZZ
MFTEASLIIIAFTGGVMLGMMYYRLILRWKEMAKNMREIFDKAVENERKRKKGN